MSFSWKLLKWIYSVLEKSSSYIYIYIYIYFIKPHRDSIPDLLLLKLKVVFSGAEITAA